MNLARISTPLLAVPMALLAVTALPKQAQAQCSSGYSVPDYSYAPAPQVHYRTSEAYYPPPPVVYYERPRRSFSFGLSIGGSQRGHGGHHGHHVRHGHRSHGFSRFGHSGHRNHSRGHHRGHGGGFGFHIGNF